MKNIGLKFYAGIQAILLSGTTLITFSACNKKTKQDVDNTTELVEMTSSDETTVNYDAFDITTSKTKTTTTKVYTTEVQDETSKRDGSTETTAVKDNKNDKNNNVNSDNANNNVNSGNTNDNYVDDNNYVDNNSNNRDNSNNNVRNNSGNSGRGNNNQNPQTQPPVTQPPVTQPPVTEPPVTQPPVTEPPVIETQPPVQQPVGLQAIGSDFSYFYDRACDLNLDIMNIPGYMMSSINMPYGNTTGALESYFVLGALNPNYVNDQFMSWIFGENSQDCIGNCVDFICNFNWVQSTMGNDVDYSKYTVDPAIGNYLNQVDDAYRNGQNVGLNYLDNPGVCGILRSYGYDVNIENVNEFANRISQATFGTQLTRS